MLAHRVVMLLFGSLGSETYNIIDELSNEANMSSQKRLTNSPFALGPAEPVSFISSGSMADNNNSRSLPFAGQSIHAGGAKGTWTFPGPAISLCRASVGSEFIKGACDFW